MSPSEIQAYKHAKFETLNSRAAIASAKRSNILSSKRRGLERSAAEAVAYKFPTRKSADLNISLTELFDLIDSHVVGMRIWGMP